MHEHLSAFVEAATGAFELEGPVYEFGASSVNRTGCGDGFCDCFAEANHAVGNPDKDPRTKRLDDLARRSPVRAQRGAVVARATFRLGRIHRCCTDAGRCEGRDVPRANPACQRRRIEP